MSRRSAPHGGTGVTTAAATPAAKEVEHEPPFAPAPIEEMLRLLAKGVRAHQLYLHNNPTYVRAIEVLRASFPPIWERADNITLVVTESEFVWEGVVVLREGGGESSDSLPWVFYKDGVRELLFEKGFEEADLMPFLDVIQRARRTGRDGEDLLVMLWEQELHHLRYRYVDVGGNGPVGVADFSTKFEPHVIAPPSADNYSQSKKCSRWRVRKSSISRITTRRCISSTKTKSRISRRRSRRRTPTTSDRTSWPFYSTSSKYNRIPSSARKSRISSTT